MKLLVQRGMKTLPIEVSATKCQDVFLVERNAIQLQFIDYCNSYIRDLYTSDLNLDFDKIQVFSMLQQISFTSYGNDTFSSISLLIDSIVVQTDKFSKCTADFALVTFVQSLTLTDEQKNELIELLESRYLVTDTKRIDVVLQRVKDCLLLTKTTNIPRF